MALLDYLRTKNIFATCTVKWKYTKIVHVMSTAFSPNAILNAKRTQKDGTSALVECPQSVPEYTKRMGGVDRFDRSRGHYVSHKTQVTAKHAIIVS